MLLLKSREIIKPRNVCLLKCLSFRGSRQFREEKSCPLVENHNTIDSILLKSLTIDSKDRILLGRILITKNLFVEIFHIL